jgi:hypothetical protein
MAKSSLKKVSSRAGASVQQVLDMCSAAERKLLAATETSALATATHDSVKSLLIRVREARDKWRGLFGKQTRVQKRATTPATAEANARSMAKADLFGGAVKRLEDRLATLVPAAKPAGSSRAAKKSARKAGHRDTRAAIRAELAQATATINRALGGSRAAPAASAAKKTEKQPAASPAPQPAAAATKPAAAKSRKLPPAKRATQTVRLDFAQQRSARTAATSGRLKTKGITTRRAGHTLAAGKRAQARRDKRAR